MTAATAADAPCAACGGAGWRTTGPDGDGRVWAAPCAQCLPTGPGPARTVLAHCPAQLDVSGCRAVAVVCDCGATSPSTGHAPTLGAALAAHARHVADAVLLDTP